MSEGSIATRYAKAILELAQKQGKVDAFQEQLGVFASALKESADLNTVFVDPAFTVSQRKQVLEKIVSKFSVAPEVLSFLKLLVDRERVRLLPEILLSYRDQADEIEGRIRVEISSPYELKAEEEKKLQEKLEKILSKKVLLQKKKDSSLLGGMLIRVKDTVFDGSLKNSLEKIKQQMMEAPLP